MDLQAASARVRKGPFARTAQRIQLHVSHSGNNSDAVCHHATTIQTRGMVEYIVVYMVVYRVVYIRSDT